MSVAENSGARLIRRVATAGVWAIAGRAGLGLTGLTVNALVVRLLQPDHVGIYFLIVSGIAMAVVVSQFGLQHAVVRLAAEAIGVGEPGRAAGVIRFALLTGCGLAACVGMVIAVSGDALIRYSPIGVLVPGTTALIGIWVVAKTAEGLVAESFRGLHDVRLATLQNMLLANFLLVLMLGVLWLGSQANLLLVMALSVSATLVAAIAGFPLLQRRLKRLAPAIRPKPIAVLRTAAPMLVTSIMLIVISQADLWIVGWFLSPEQAAVYGSAIRLVQLVMVPMLIVNAVLPPYIASLYSEGRVAELEQIVRAAASVGCIPTACVLMVLWLAAAPLLELIYGPFYRDGAATLILVSAGQLVNGLVGASAVVLMMTGHQFSIMWISLVCVAFQVVSSVALVEHYGLEGVAAATGLSIALHGLLSLVWVKRKTGMWTFCGGLDSIRRIRSTLQSGH